MDWYNIAVAVGLSSAVGLTVTIIFCGVAVQLAKKEAKEMVARAHNRITKVHNRVEEAHARITTIRDGVVGEIKTLREWRTVNDEKTAALEKYLSIEFKDKEYTVERKDAHYEKVGKKK